MGGISTLVASQFLAAFTVVTSTGERADSSNLAHFGKVIGVTLADIASGFSGNIADGGEVQNLSWTWPSGNVIFLNGVGLTTTPPIIGFSQKIGLVKNSSTIWLELETPVLL
jgi:predicted RecA/RadA family phage recombinase